MGSFIKNSLAFIGLVAVAAVGYGAYKYNTRPGESSDSPEDKPSESPKGDSEE